MSVAKSKVILNKKMSMASLARNVPKNTFYTATNGFRWIDRIVAGQIQGVYVPANQARERVLQQYWELKPDCKPGEGRWIDVPVERIDQ